MATSVELARVLVANAAYASRAHRSGLPAPPSRRLAVLACMDARLDVAAALGLGQGEAHVIRNAGGLATDDALRSLVVSHRLLGAETVLVIGHTGCGMLGLDESAARRELIAATGVAVDLPLLGFEDLEASIRAQVERIRSHPWLRGLRAHGVVFDVETGRLRALD
ncbi:MAG TPA: carbonic anhydrase [Candidatus Limnocylindrales bacterium]